MKPPSRFQSRPVWFPFYVADWLSSEKIALMTPEAEAAYLRLLLHAWTNDTCSIPDDDEALAILSRLNEGWAAHSGPVKAAFESHPKLSGRLINRRLYEERVKQEAAWLTQKRAGVKSADARGKRGRVRSTDPQRTPLGSKEGDLNHPHPHPHPDAHPDDVLEEEDARAREKPKEREEPHPVDRLVFEFHFGWPKARDIVERLGTTNGDLDEWIAYEREKGTRLAKWGVQRFKNPAAIPPPVEGKNGAGAARNGAAADEDFRRLRREAGCE